MKQIILNEMPNGNFHLDYNDLMSIVKEVQAKISTNSISQLDSQLLGIAISRMACGEMVQDEIPLTNKLLKPLEYEVIVQ